MTPGAYGAQTPVGGWQPASGPPSAWQTVGSTPNATVPGTAGPTPRKLDDALNSPSGLTPKSKKPMDHASIQVALTGERPMSHDELTSGFYQLLRRVEQEEAYTSHMREVMIFNGDIVDN